MEDKIVGLTQTERAQEGKRQLVLASGSPRRRELLGLLGVGFEVVVSDVDESVVTVADPAVNALETARLKTVAVVERLQRMGRMNVVVLGSDTNVAFGGLIFGKPRDEAEAFETLAMLRRKVHQVHTGVVLMRGDSAEIRQFTATSDVYMREYSDEAIFEYIKTGDPMDKAGAYSIQHSVFRPFETYEGCYAGVMGLPICHLIEPLREMGIVVSSEIVSDCPQGYCYQQLAFDPLCW